MLTWGILLNKWIKQNLVLVSGILLPVLLVGSFFVLSNVPTILADPPKYDFLLLSYRYDYQHPSDYFLSFEVRDGMLKGHVNPKGEGNANMHRQYAEIFRYNSKENVFDQIDYDLPLARPALSIIPFASKARKERSRLNITSGISFSPL
ncbi:MAG: hypothetical protein ACI9H8_000996 [Lysobacterales bacterium]